MIAAQVLISKAHILVFFVYTFTETASNKAIEMDEVIEPQSSSEPEPPPAAVTIRRTLTMKNNAARQVAVNFMPSRQLSYSKSN